MDTLIMHWAQSLQEKKGGCIVVGEVKEKSPFGFQSKYDRYQQLKWLDTWADIISIHTNPLWGGSFEWLEEARSLTKRPILAKGFHDTIHDVNKAFKYGADHVLTVGWFPGDHRCWHECETFADLLDSNAQTVVWNSRNPRDGSLRTQDIGTVVKLFKKWKPNSCICQASNISKPEDVMPKVNLALIGEGLYKNIRL